MSELLQSARHPDADQLTAFAEHALPAHEREQTLAHLATCAVCRQLVFLAQAEEPVQAAQLVAVKTAWFAGWNLLWPAVAALAGIVWVSVHLRHATSGGSAGQKVALATEPPPIPVAPPLAPAVHSQAVVPAAKPMPRVVVKVPGIVAPVTVVNGDLQQQGMAIQAQEQASPGLVRNREKTPGATLDAPMLNQQQQIVVAAAPPPVAQQYGQAPMSPAQATPPHPATVMAGMGVAGAAPAAKPKAAPPVAVTLGGTARAVTAAASRAAPQAAAQGASQPVSVDALSDMTESNAISVTSASAKAPGLAELPSGKATISKISNGALTVALDAAGAVFVSKNSGGAWTAVKPQWPGRAVRVSLNPAFANVASGRNVYTLAGRSARGLSIAHNALADGTHAQIAGSVTDATGAAIPGAMIRVKNSAGSDVSSVRADANGGFATRALDPGQYAVQIAAPGFINFTQTVQLQARDQASLGAALQVAGENQTVTVTSAQNHVEEVRSEPEPFTLTTDAGVTWTSKDGEKWKRQ